MQFLNYGKHNMPRQRPTNSEKTKPHSANLSQPAKITALMLVKNEEQWVWYALNSVLPSVDQVIVFDTGSTDRTVAIINRLNSPKIRLFEKGGADRRRLVELRNEMLTLASAGWFLLVDGDEVWPGSALKKLIRKIATAPPETWGIVCRTRNCVGDIWHYQPESAGRYEFLGRQGHLTIRAYRKLKGFRWKGEYPLEYFSDRAGRPINSQSEHLDFLDAAYWHLTHLRRTSRPEAVIDRPEKFKLEVGLQAGRNELPDIFFAPQPADLPDPAVGYTFTESVAAGILTPLKKIKRRLRR